MSTLVEESLSVSGILLGKTMGRAPSWCALQRRVGRARRARGARAHGRALADGLGADELRDHARARLLVRGGRRGGDAISIGTVVAFTTLQTRLLFPIQSLLSVGLEVQTSLALFGRIFEYLDLPVDIVERPGRAS